MATPIHYPPYPPPSNLQARELAANLRRLADEFERHEISCFSGIDVDGFCGPGDWGFCFTVYGDMGSTANPLLASIHQSAPPPPPDPPNMGPIYREPKKFCQYLGSARSGR
jgi:hypothetical protein